MVMKLSPEQIAAIDALPPGHTLELVDEKNNREYILFDKQAYERWVAIEVQKGLDDIERGNVSELDMAAIKAEARARFERRKASA